MNEAGNIPDERSPTPSAHTRAEFDRLAEERDRLRRELSRAREQLKNFTGASRLFASTVRDRLGEKRTSDLQQRLLGELGRIGPDDDGDLRGQVISAIGRTLNRRCVVLWELDDGLLKCAGLWRAPDGHSSSDLEDFEQACRASDLRDREGFPGRVLDLGEPLTEDELEDDPRVPSAVEAGLGPVWAFPVRGGGLTWIIEAFGKSGDSGGEVTKMLSSLGFQVEQMVERRRAEVALKASEARLRRAVEIDTVGVLFFNVEGNITDANEAFLRMVGYERKDLENNVLKWDALTPPEWMPRSKEAIEELKAAGRTAPYEKEYFRKDGTRWMGLFSAKRLDEKENVEFVLDVTESKKIEKELRESEQWLHFAQKASSAGTWEWNLVSGEIRWSREHRELFGLAPDEPITREKWWRNIPDEEVAEIQSAWRRCEAGEEFIEIEYCLREEEGVRWMNARGRTLTDQSGRPERVIGLTIETTERKNSERERERLRFQEWVTRVEVAERERISRDLHDRTAHDLGVAHQSLELYTALRQSSPSRANDRLELAKRLVKHSLDSTRQLSAELRRSDVEDDLKGALTELIEALQTQEVEIEMRLDGDEAIIPDQIKAQMYLIIREATSNAVRHSKGKTVEVSVRISREEIRSLIKDDGAWSEENVNKDGVGLRSMRERAELLSGGIAIHRSDDGTSLEAWIPRIEKPEEARR